jgi:hypothetical protein
VAHRVLPKLFPNNPFDAIAIYRQPQNSFWNRDCYTRTRQHVPADFGGKLRARKACTVPKQGDDLTLDKSVPTTEGVTFVRLSRTPQRRTRNLRLGWRNAGVIHAPAGALDCDARAAFGAPGVDHASAANGFHADPETMGFLAAGD